MDKKIFEEIESSWKSVTQQPIEEFVRIPALSIDFDKQWDKNGHLLDAVLHAKRWADSLGLEGISMEAIQEEGAPPCLFADIPGTGAKKDGKTVFLYGHLDKQPENTGWDENKSAWKPVVENGRLYGRGAADDGYSWFCTLSALRALDKLGIDRPHCVALFETAEESSSFHYEKYLERMKSHLGDVGLVVILDSTALDYKRLWITQSLRGTVNCMLKVQVLEHDMHSGEAGGIVPSSFMIVRSLLDRMEDANTGKIRLDALHCDIPKEVIKQTKALAKVCGKQVFEAFPWEGATKPEKRNPWKAILSRNWEPALAVVGAGGIPSIAEAGAILRAQTTLKLCMRIPPLVDPEKAAKAMKQCLTEKPPFKATVSMEGLVTGPGWYASGTPQWLKKALNQSSKAFWGEEAGYLGIGASIPLVAHFSKVWPETAFMVAGVLGPNSNAHGPNEFLDLEYAKRLTASVAKVISEMPVKKQKK